MSEVRGKGGRRRVAVVGDLLEGAEHDGVDLGRQAGDQGARGRGALVDERAHELVKGRRQERDAPREQVVERRAESVDVRASVGRALVRDLLGRHVERRADHDARLGQALARLVAREAEVGEHGRAVLAADEDVRGLDVAVEDPRRVDVVEAARDLLGDLEGAPPRDLAPGDELVEALALDELEDAEERVALEAGGVDAHDVALGLEARERLGLALEAGAVELVALLEERDLDRVARSGVVAAEEDGAHGSLAQGLLDHVAGDPVAGGQAAAGRSERRDGAGRRGDRLHDARGALAARAVAEPAELALERGVEAPRGPESVEQAGALAGRALERGAGGRGVEEPALDGEARESGVLRGVASVARHDSPGVQGGSGSSKAASHGRVRARVSPAARGRREKGRVKKERCAPKKTTRGARSGLRRAGDRAGPSSCPRDARAGAGRGRSV